MFKNYCQRPASWYRPSVRTATPIRCAVKRVKSNLFQVAKSRLKISNTSTISRELLFETKLVIAISTVGTGKRNWWWGSHQNQKTSKTDNQTWDCLSDTIVSSNITLLYCLNSALSGELIRLFVKVGKAQRCFKRCIYMGAICPNRTPLTWHKILNIWSDCFKLHIFAFNSHMFGIIRHGLFVAELVHSRCVPFPQSFQILLRRMNCKFATPPLN